MNMIDDTSLRGNFRLTVKKNGVVIEEYHDENMIMTLAKDAMAKLIGGDGSGKTVTHIGFGSNGNGPAPDDIALTGSYSKEISSVTYPVAGQVTFAWTLGTNEANGMAIMEFGLICDDDTLFSRKTRGVINKENDISLDGTWTIIF